MGAPILSENLLSSPETENNSMKNLATGSVARKAGGVIILQDSGRSVRTRVSAKHLGMKIETSFGSISHNSNDSGI